jgi:hypothetical protein
MKGMAILLALFLIAPASAASADITPELRQATRAGHVEIVMVWGPITKKRTSEITRQLRNADIRKARVALLDMDTPGGDPRSAEQILGAIAKYPNLRVIAYISGRHYGGTWGAGALIALGGNRIAIDDEKAFSFATQGVSMKGKDMSIPLALSAAQLMRMGALGGKRGLSRAVADGLIKQDGEVWLLKAEGREPTATAEYAKLTEEQQKKAKRVKTAGTALVLMARDAEAIGLATVLSEEDVAVELGLVSDKQLRAFLFKWRMARSKAAKEIQRSTKVVRLVKKALVELDTLITTVQMRATDLSRASSRKEVESGRDALKRLVRVYGTLEKRIRDLPHLVLGSETFKERKRVAEADLKKLDLLAALLPNVKRSEYGGDQNEKGYHPIYTFQGENHRGNRMVHTVRDATASGNKAALAPFNTREMRITRIRPGGMPEGLYVARFHMKVDWATAHGDVRLTVSLGREKGTLLVNKTQAYKHERGPGYTPYDVVFKASDRPIEITVKSKQLQVSLDRIEIWRSKEIVPLVPQTEPVDPDKPRRQPTVIILQ